MFVIAQNQAGVDELSRPHHHHRLHGADEYGYPKEAYHGEAKDIQQPRIPVDQHKIRDLLQVDGGAQAQDGVHNGSEQCLYQRAPVRLQQGAETGKGGDLFITRFEVVAGGDQQEYSRPFLPPAFPAALLHAAAAGVHDLDVLLRHPVHHHEVVQPLIDDDVGHGGKFRLVFQGFLLGTYAPAGEAELFRRLNHPQQVGALLVGARQLADARYR